MEEEHARRVTLEDYSSIATPQFFTSIAKPEVQAANISYPHSLIQLIKGSLFHGLLNEDPYAHLATYIEICNTDEVVEKFLKKYFPESKTAEGKMEISSFHQFVDESLSEALDRFLGLLRKMPTHGYSELVQLNIFIDGLRPISEIEALTETLSKLPQQLQSVSPSHSPVMQIGGCHICGGAHEPGQCIAQEDSSRGINYKGAHNRHRFQGYNQGGPPGFNQGRNFSQGSR
ncbi:hypothetical protein HKD37_14G040993 [Glycine soja]